MDFNRTIEILEALASGCSPLTGEVVNESILNEREVIRALQIAIDKLKNENYHHTENIDINKDDIHSAINLFIENEINISSHNLTGFFLATKKFKSDTANKNQLYGKLINFYTKGQLFDFFNQYLTNNKISNRKNIKNELYREIDFFKKDKFNRLTDSAIAQLKEKINVLGVLKTENLSEYIQNSRKNYARAYESWSEEEIELLSKAIKYTND
jgi:hypothetical protein